VDDSRAGDEAPRSLWAELKRRKVIRAVLAYAIVGWLVIQVAEATFDPLHLPAWSQTLVIVLVALGLPLVAVLAWVFELTPGGLRREAPVPVPGPLPPDRAESDNSPAALPAPADTPAAGDASSIAVLPFADMSAEQDQGYFCDGVAEEILNILARIPGLRVASRTSSFQFKGYAGDITEIGRQLRAGTLLEGSVRKSGERLRVTAQLIETGSGYHLWSERFDVEASDVFKVQETIAEKIAAALRISLQPEDRDRMRRGQTQDLEAYDFYLRGLWYFHTLSWRNFEYAREMFRHALELDPGFGRAWAGLAYVAAFIYMYQNADPAFAAEADEASRKALELCRNTAEAHVARGVARSIAGAHDEAEAEFRKAIDLDPDLYEACYLYGRAAAARGEYEKAAELFERAARVNADDYQAAALLPQVYAALGRKDKRLEWTERALSRASRQLARHPDDVRALYLGSGAAAHLGDFERSRWMAERALELAPNDGSVAYSVACSYVALGDHERALDLLEQASMPAMANRAWVEHDADLAPLRGNPRFKALLARLKD
jgi:adenylate cyclase